MCCALTTLFFFGPRVALLVWWLIHPGLFRLAFNHWVLPLLFAIFAPYTMIFYIISWYLGPGISGFEWILIMVGIFLDITSYGGGYRSRRR